MSTSLDSCNIQVLGRRILVDKVAGVGPDTTHKVSEHLYAPAQTERTRRVYGVEAHVIKVGPGVPGDEIREGDTIIMDEFGGRPIFWGGRPTPYFIVGDSEVFCVLRDEEAHTVAPRLRAVNS